jgi:hypothetical protein
MVDTMKNAYKNFLLLTSLFLSLPLYPMHRRTLQKTMRRLTIHQIQQRSFSDQPTDYIQLIHVAAIAFNTYGLSRVTAPGSIPAHCGGIALGTTASTPEALLGSTILTTFAFINDYHYKQQNNKK